MTLTDAQVKGLADILAGIYRTELKAGENYKNKTMGDRKIATEVINQCYKQIETMVDVLEVLGEDAVLVFEKSDRLLKEIKANDLEEEYREFKKNVLMCGSLDMVGYMYVWEK